MKEITLILPHQLFKEHPALSKDRPVILYEDPLFFTEFNFHPQKIRFHKDSMAHYEAYLKKKGYDVKLVTHDKKLPKCEEIIMAEPSDDWALSRLQKHAKVTPLPSPAFLNPLDDLLKKLGKKDHYSLKPFYVSERKARKILVKGDKPIGEKWSLDAENRKKLPKNLEPPKLPKFHDDSSFIWPTTHEQAEKALQDFFKERFKNFGPYEDAISREHDFIFHSLLSPLLNVGLLTPKQVIDEALEYSQKHDIPLNSLEGFIRQIIGWREFIRGVYHLEGRKQRTSNFWKHKNKLPKSFWTGETGIEPVDTVIQRVNQNAYSHHIERLMIMGNFMLLCEVYPDEVYRWFMERYIDAYDWVMVPNVYGMSQYADGGLMTSKPYISGSNYIRKMSDFKKGDWCDVWDGLYWRFIHKHKDFFAKNPRLSVMTLALKRMSKEKLETHIENAEEFLAKTF